MTDPLSVAAGAAGLISLGIQITDKLIQIYSSYKHRDSNIARTTEKLENLLGTFQVLARTLQHRRDDPLMHQIDFSIRQGREIIQELQEECDKLTKSLCGSAWSATKSVGRRIAYPFRISTLTRLDEDVDEICSHLSFALDVLQLKDNRTIQDDLAEVKSVIELIRTTQISVAIRDWLRAPDVSINHNAACAKRHPGTGRWFIQSQQFQKWIDQSATFLWLHGIAGCGKSVLCSTAIQYAYCQKGRGSRVGVACFYFTFNDESKQDESAMLRALLLQLADQLADGHSVLQRLRDAYTSSPPPPPTLRDCLRQIIHKFDQVYILIDALDESPRYEGRDSVLESIITLREWALPQLHILVTSRDELDIREMLSPCDDEDIFLKDSGIDEDISNFITQTLDTDPALRRKWHRDKENIRQTMTQRADGNFRWVECQFAALKRCPGSKDHLDDCLKSLPRTLDETYERMLCTIDENSVDEARRILTLLCFASRPLTGPELLHGTAVNLREPAGLNRRRLLGSADDLQDICPGLIDFEVQESSPGSDDRQLTTTVRIAHFSVQAYLESDQIRKHKAALFALSASSAHAEISQICCVYLLDAGLSNGELISSKLQNFPFAHFAALFWYHHYKKSGDESFRIYHFIKQIFVRRRDSFYTLFKLHDVVERPWITHVHFSRPSSELAAPLYCASYLGLTWIVEELLVTGTDCKNADENDVNTQGGWYGNALQAASAEGHIEIVELLLEHDANVNAQGGSYGNALQAASAKGHMELVNLLLKHGADVNAQGGSSGNALQAALQEGHIEVIKLLLKEGANVNGQGGSYHNPLGFALSGGHIEVFKLLLEKGVNVNEQGRYSYHNSYRTPAEYFGTALQAMSAKGHIEVIQLLLDHGADVNAQDSQRVSLGNALQAALVHDRIEAAKLLLENGADINAQGGMYGNALQAASARGHIEVLQLFVEKGADINAQGGMYGNALQAALRQGHIEVAELLLRKGANVNAQSGHYGNALQATLADTKIGGQIEVVEMLLENGANINAQGGYYGNALQTASISRHIGVVKLLLENGANVNAQGGYYGCALQAASVTGCMEIVELLLENGANVNAQGGYHGCALQAASATGCIDVVELLLKSGANVNVQGGYHGNALQAASVTGCIEVVELLLKSGASVTAQCGYYGNALQAASAKGHIEVVKLLLEHGANINAQGGHYGHALEAASYFGENEIVEILLKKGAVWFP